MKFGDWVFSLSFHAAAVGAVWVLHRPVVVSEEAIPVEPLVFETVVEESPSASESIESEVEPQAEAPVEPELPVQPEEPPVPDAVEPKSEEPPVAPSPIAAEAADPSPSEGREERAKVVSAPFSLNRLEPKYPRSARRRNAEGSVTVEFSVGADGRVISAEVVKSSGSRDLDDSALATAGKARFAPATEDGLPVASTIRLTFEFRLR